jgi:hypothetical protein
MTKAKRKMFLLTAKTPGKLLFLLLQAWVRVQDNFSPFVPHTKNTGAAMTSSFELKPW